jgi:hypothetical protein
MLSPELLRQSPARMLQARKSSSDCDVPDVANAGAAPRCCREPNVTAEAEPHLERYGGYASVVTVQQEHRSSREFVTFCTVGNQCFEAIYPQAICYSQLTRRIGNSSSHGGAMKRETKESLSSLESLTVGRGGTALLGESYRNNSKIEFDYVASIRALEQYDFWNAGRYSYLPSDGLWAPQRRAIALSLAYLSSQRLTHQPLPDIMRESALIKMPTGSGKTAVIATLACCAAKVKRTIILTPRKALVEQMMQDLSWRFWSRFDYCYIDTILDRRSRQNAEFLAKLEHRKATSIDRLSEKGYLEIWKGRQKERQIIVGTFNALHAVLGIEPPAHRSMQGSEARKPAAVLQDCKKDPTDRKGIENFRSLLRETDLLIVDEGHYEPAFSWAQCVESLNVPTIIFSATPYRNDYKYFNVLGNFAFNLSFQEAVEHQIIREVVFEPRHEATPRRSARTRERFESLKNFVAFIRSRCKRYPMLSENRPLKCIVHGATYETLKALQCEIYAQDSTLRAVLIHDAHTRTAKSLNGDLKKLGRAAEAALAPYRFQHVHEANDPNGVGPTSRIWLHQFKLLEGIDNADFHEIFLYDGFRSARELIQQVGRALRYAKPNRKNPESANIFGALRPYDSRAGDESIESVSNLHWNNYLRYEQYVAKEPARAFTAETQLLSLLKKTAPEWQYIGREFRKGFFTDETSTLEEYLLPRRAVICYYIDPTQKPQSANARILTNKAFDKMARACAEAFKLEDRFDMRIVPAPAAQGDMEDVRLIRYLTWRNSRNLRQESIPEWNLGMMAIVRSSPFVFLLDTETLCIDFERLGLFSVPPEEMKRLFSDPKATRRSPDRIRVIEASAAGLDLSDNGIRSMTIRKRNLSDGYFDLAEASQAPSSLHGVAVLEDIPTRRQLSIRRGRIADPTTRYIGLKDYLVWSRSIAKALSDSSTVLHPFFSRFAQEVAPPTKDDGEAQNLLLDIWDLLNPDDASFVDRKWDPKMAKEILEFDRCMELERVADEGKPSDFAFVLGGRYPIHATYERRNTIPPKGRYRLQCPELDEALITPNTPTQGTLEISPFGGGPTDRATSLIALINQEQCFRVIPAATGVVYANDLFFKPSIDWDAVNEGQDGNLLDHLVVSKSLKHVVSEKGESGVTPATWATHSQFGIVLNAFNRRGVLRNDTLTTEIAKSDLLVCDDGAPEIADFICVQPRNKKVLLIHAKAKDAEANVSAANLETVGRQASASLAFIGSSRTPLAFPTHWPKQIKIKNRKTKRRIQTVDRIHSRHPTTPQEAHLQVVAALADPTYGREIWVVTSGLLSKAQAKEDLGGSVRERRALQFAYYLADLRTTFGRAGVTLKIFTAD